MYEVQLGQLHYETEVDPVASHVYQSSAKSFLSRLVSFVMEARSVIVIVFLLSDLNKR